MAVRCARGRFEGLGLGVEDGGTQLDAERVAQLPQIVCEVAGFDDRHGEGRPHRDAEHATRKGVGTAGAEDHAPDSEAGREANQRTMFSGSLTLGQTANSVGVWAADWSSEVRVSIGGPGRRKPQARTPV